MAFTEALKPKAGSKHLSTIINAEGKAVLAESREDEIQKIKYQEIIKLLIGAGYFRAKIKGLSEFDKVVGGMTWCIDVCTIDLDVDLLFQENSTIGQKIALTEKIVAVLPKMKCPYTIEPHQIQGLDFIHIHPVIEWLVKKSLENREERGDYIRQYAVHQFNMQYCFPNERPNENFILRALPNIFTVQNKYRPHRKFRRVENQPTDTFSRIQSTLFEYGHTPIQENQSEGEENQADRELEKIDEAKLQQLTKSMKATSSDAPIAPKTISSIINMKASEIKDAAAMYSNLVTESELDEKNELAKLKNKEKALLEQVSALNMQLKTANNKLKVLKEKTNFREQTDNQLTEEEKRIVKELEIRILLNNSLLEQENQFKEYCKSDRQRLQELIRGIEEDNSVDNETGASLSQLNRQVAEARISLAKISRSEAGLHRLIDEVPSRAELTQYQGRFLELYNQVSAKHRETKQFYTLYNAMRDEHEYLTKELSLLKSIANGFVSSVNSIHVKEEFIKQFEAIVDGVKHNKLKVEQKRNEERDMRDKLRLHLSGLVDQHRLYVSLLKQFTLECEENQKLIAQVKVQS
ncbi:coiled-coil domain-containing protein 93 [Cimex lectularius]|uniref:Coiled-coil domain-containing protein 93 n=1 Tax=Cimex lectularius TaxID=79782 RepID=A0A8I6SD29_CIMLE|nr:coiled-coil domain-containing protein 93 [Cimex lectularius]